MVSCRLLRAARSVSKERANVPAQWPEPEISHRSSVCRRHRSEISLVSMQPREGAGRKRSPVSTFLQRLPTSAEGIRAHTLRWRFGGEVSPGPNPFGRLSAFSAIKWHRAVFSDRDGLGRGNTISDFALHFLDRYWLNQRMSSSEWRVHAYCNRWFRLRRSCVWGMLG